MIPAVSYLRMSDPRQDTSLGDQRAAIAGYAKAHGFKVIREYADEGISGDATEKRIAFQRMIADAPAGQFKAILAWDQSRFGRFDIYEGGFYIFPLRSAGVYLETVADGRINWDDFAGRIVAAVKMESNHDYLRSLSRNVLRGMLRAADNGKVMWTPPFGYATIDGRCVPTDDAEVVRRIFSDCLLGKTARQIAVALNNDGIAKPGSGAWTRNFVIRILKNETYTGVYRWGAGPKGKYSRVINGEIAAPRDAVPTPTRIVKSHEAIVDEDVFREAQEKIAANRTRTSPRKGRAFLLSGLIVCGKCGGAMYGRDRKGRMVYQCALALVSGKCQRNTVNEPEVMDWVVRYLREWFSQKSLERRAAESVREQIEAIRTAKSDAPRYRQQLATINQKIAKAEKRLFECDAEFLPVVQSKLRELVSTRDAIAASLKLAEKRQKDVVDDSRQHAKAIVASVETLSRSIHTAPAERVRELLRTLIRRVECHTKQVPWGSRFAYRLESIEVIAHT